MKPKEIIEKFVEYFNEGDADRIAELYHDDAINHQVTNEPVSGKADIRNMFAREFLQAEMICIGENIFEDGEWGILE
ncbi:YybH family protein [Carboxylicivirga marina]|uniref:YybH family protein n=1 Tax=Carboxylicivirga marina TaxID=2800988 RepID=UPI0025917B9B|nr:nuclear transport factor 2 family protein [uncultured Carboxylicivirga sp.]